MNCKSGTGGYPGPAADPADFGIGDEGPEGKKVPSMKVLLISTLYSSKVNAS